MNLSSLNVKKLSVGIIGAGSIGCYLGGARGRNTEVDQLNGEIVRLAEAHGLDAPVNRRLVALMREVEANRSGLPNLSASEIATHLRLSAALR